MNVERDKSLMDYMICFTILVIFTKIMLIEKGNRNYFLR
jgi:hypothetical protein